MRAAKERKMRRLLQDMKQRKQELSEEMKDSSGTYILYYQLNSVSIIK